MGLARVAVCDMAVKAQLTLSAQAQGYFIPVAGARSPIGPARARVEMVELVELRGDNRKERLTPLGYRTARLRQPRALSVLELTDCRLQVALRYQHLAEKVGAVGSGTGDLAGGGSGRVSDGGAVYRTALAAELRALRACLVGVALPRANSRGNRRDVTVTALVDGVVLGGQEIKAVLRAHGWSGLGLYVKVLTEALHEALYGMSEVQERY